MALLPTQAQQRFDDIQAFRRETGRLAEAGIHAASEAQQTQIDAYHKQLLHDYSTTFAVDPDYQTKRLSLGMRIASFIGATALSASLVFLFYQFWGHFTETAQTAILAGASISTLALTAWLHQRDRSGYFCRLAAFIALACFVLNIVVLAQIYNLSPSDMALLPWAALALLLAYRCRSRLLLAVGLACLTGFIATRIMVWSGHIWTDFNLRPENFYIAAVLLFLFPLFVEQHRFDRFAETYRLVALLVLFLPMLYLANSGDSSYLPFSRDDIKSLYQIAGFTIAALLTGWGVRRNWAETVNTGVIFFSIFLYIKLFDWWWESMPKYQFFFMIGLIALTTLWVLSRLRHTLRRELAP